MTAPAKRSYTRDDDKCIVYFLANMAMGTVKVGKTTNLKKRVDVLQTGNHDRLEVCCFIHAHRPIESIIHGALAAHRIRNEWFEHNACVDNLIRKIEEFEILQGIKHGDFSPVISTDDICDILNAWENDENTMPVEGTDK